MLGADCAARRSNAFDKQLFNKAGLDMNGPAFNSGVLAINLNNWRSKNALKTFKKVEDQYGEQTSSADQTILNIAFHDQVSAFGSQYNNPLYSDTALPESLDDCIYHFVGSPKPWDLFGSTLHNNYSIWKKFHQQSAIGNQSTLPYLSIKRITMTSKQLLRAIKNKFKH